MIRSAKNIVLGTANFGQPYNGVHVLQGEREKIWDYALQQGIEFVDTATAYGDIEIPDEFKVIRKCKLVDGTVERAYCVMSHDTEMHGIVSKFATIDPSVWADVKIGHSMYTPEELPQEPFDIAQIPYSLINRTFEPHLRMLKAWDVEIHARSIFGVVLNLVTVKDAVDFVVANQHVDKIVIGVENVEQLKEIVQAVESD